MKANSSKQLDMRGFTMIELMVALVISMVALSGIYYTYQSQQRSYIHQERVAAMQQNLRAAIYYMEREIRMAGYDPTGLTSAGIPTQGANTIQVTLDLDEDGTISGDSEDVTFDMSGTDLRRNSNVIAEDISALNFTYVDQDANGTVESVQISVTATTTSGQITTRTINTQVKCRNLDL